MHGVIVLGRAWVLCKACRTCIRRNRIGSHNRGSAHQWAVKQGA